MRCELTGEPIFGGYTPEPNVADAFQVHFNPNAFRRPRPNGAIGNLGDAPPGVLRHPSWWNWDFTLARRFPIKVPGSGRTSNLRVQLQAYNMWDAVQFTTMDALYTFSATGNTAPTTGHVHGRDQSAERRAHVPVGFLEDTLTGIHSRSG